MYKMNCSFLLNYIQTDIKKFMWKQNAYIYVENIIRKNNILCLNWKKQSSLSKYTYLRRRQELLMFITGHVSRARRIYTRDSKASARSIVTSSHRVSRAFRTCPRSHIPSRKTAKSSMREKELRHPEVTYAWNLVLIYKNRRNNHRSTSISCLPSPLPPLPHLFPRQVVNPQTLSFCNSPILSTSNKHHHLQFKFSLLLLASPKDIASDALQISLVRTFSARTYDFSLYFSRVFFSRIPRIYLGSRKTPRTSRNVAFCVFCVSPLPDGLAPRS